jgi:4-aminobutyrate aminotransferase-like enzyme
MSSATRQRGPANNAFDPDTLANLPAQDRDLIHRRQELLGPAYRLFYQRPLHFVRGRGTRLWDVAGEEYLDAYNNVVPVGHTHPRVVEAVYEQMQTLNTNTRYLNENILNYAEDLLGTFSGPVAARHAMFTCTGSDANDLALRIAKYRTGQEGVIVTSWAYHGNTRQLTGVSPSLGDASPLAPWCRRVPTPDSYRLDPAELPQRFANWVEEQIEHLNRHGHGVAALLLDTSFSSDGLFVDTDVLAPAVERVREAGGLFIADEVQPGFGRLGSHLWGHQRHGLDPDIVSMGKPMGNGFPVAGIAVKRDVVADFGHDIRYFNTFGGNTVAMAAAQATLDVIRDEGLMANAESTGAVIRNGLLELQKRHPRIGHVRGAGLYFSVEFVTDLDEKIPDKANATAVVNAMAERRVLISQTGRAGNALKIRPPLVFDSADADRLLTELSAVLDGLDA